MKKSCKGQCGLPDDKKHWAKLRRVAADFAYAIGGDSGYTNGATNRVALVSMLIGWMRSQPFWDRAEKHCAKYHKNNDLFLEANDQAVQVSQVFEGRAQFRESNSWLCIGTTDYSVPPTVAEEFMRLYNFTQSVSTRDEIPNREGWILLRAHAINVLTSSKPMVEPEDLTEMRKRTAEETTNLDLHILKAKRNVGIAI